MQSSCKDVVLQDSPGTEDLCFSSLQLGCMRVPQGHICNAEIKVLSLCLKPCAVGLSYPMSVFYSSHGDEAWVVKSVAAKWNSLGTRSSSSASIEGHALVSQHWFSITFWSELSVWCLELFWVLHPLFGTGDMVGLLNIYERLIKVVLPAVSVDSLAVGEGCDRSF